MRNFANNISYKEKGRYNEKYQVLVEYDFSAENTKVMPDLEVEIIKVEREGVEITDLLHESFIDELTEWVVQQEIKEIELMNYEDSNKEDL